ncbi:DUF1572 family protein [Psychrobacillus antarcticus]|uniref:DUF1572 family protein n=1 Tax=Psychrobacillus antarcticus TaxID=2879115 RepID=UPI0024083C8A|nr:DUF1572 family protein [Psychrobacillus antarcticus]
MTEISDVHTDFIRVVRKKFSDLMTDTEKAMMQLDEDKLFWTPNNHSNSVDVIIKHISGNLISRWTDFLTTDGEKATRNRDEEFESTIETRKELLEIWSEGCQVFLNAIDIIKSEHLLQTIYIRNEPHTVMEAVIRSLSHTSSHVGQVIYIAKQVTTEEKWTTLSIPKKRN